MGRSDSKKGYIKSGKVDSSSQKKNFKKRTDVKAKNATPKKNTNPDEIRLNRYVANSGICSRREADVFIAAGNVTVMCIGKKGMDFFGRRKQYNPIDTHVNLFADLTFDNIAPVANEIMDAFSAGDYDAVEISYGRFKNAAVQFAEVEQYLPVETAKQDAKVDVTATEDKAGKADYIFEPGKKELLEQLIPSILQNQLQKCCLDTNASEHGARMTAMDKATENAEDIVKELKFTYNKARQEAITKELSEIVGGAAALEGA